MKDGGAPVGMSWMWTLAFGQHEDRTPTHKPRAERARGGDCGVRQGLAAGMTTVFGHYPALRRAAQLWIREPIAGTIEKISRDGW